MQRWADTLPYDMEQTLVYSIDLQPWELQVADLARQSLTALAVRPEETRWAHQYEPDSVLLVQTWSDAAMEILLWAEGPPACCTRVRVEAQEWGMRMAHKRRWQAWAGFQEQHHVFLNRGPQDLPSARGMVRRRCGNVFAPITTVNDATGAPLTGAAMMQEFARQLERK